MTSKFSQKTGFALVAPTHFPNKFSIVQPFQKRSISIMRTFHRAGLILCLAAVLVSAEWGCPYPEDVEPCRCVEFAEASDNNEMVCVGVHDTQALLRVFENSRRFHFSEITLWNSTLQYLPHRIFDDIKVQRLNINSVTLRTLFDEMPISNPDLKEIFVREVKVLGGWDWKQLAVFQKLEQIFMRGTHLRKLSADFRLKVSKTLKHMYCESCRIKQLEDNVFADFHALVDLQLPSNALVDVKATMFPRNTKLRVFGLQYNKISTLPEDIFIDMPFLEQLFLAGNMLAVLPEDTFKPVMYQLKLLTLRRNPIKCDCLIAWVLQLRSGVVKGFCYAPKAIRDKPLDQLTRRDIRC